MRYPTPHNPLLGHLLHYFIKGCGCWPHGEGAAFCPCSPRMDLSHGTGGCGASLGRDGGCVKWCVLTQNALHLQDSIAHPLCTARARGPGSSTIGVCTNLEKLHRSQWKNKNMWSRNATPENPVRQQCFKDRKDPSLEEEWIHLSARANSQFGS